jgi:purine nucleosidase
MQSRTVLLLVLLALSQLALCNPTVGTERANATLVFLDHDGGIDDYLALQTLLSMLDPPADKGGRFEHSQLDPAPLTSNLPAPRMSEYDTSAYPQSSAAIPIEPPYHVAPLGISPRGDDGDAALTTARPPRQKIDLRGIVITPADCYGEPAVTASRRILDLFGLQVPLALSTVRGLNPFPELFRRDSWTIAALPVLNEYEDIRAPVARESGQSLLRRALSQTSQPMTLLVLGPLTTVAEVLASDPSLESKVERIIWMGGALEGPGNVDPLFVGGQDSTSEWNVFWDPISAERVFQTKIEIIMCPLELTGMVPVTHELRRVLSREHRLFPMYDLAASAYAMVSSRPYYFWDVLTTSYLFQPELFTTKTVEATVITHGPSQGRTLKTPIGSGAGRPITVLTSVDVDAFYAFLLRSWSVLRVPAARGH